MRWARLTAALLILTALGAGLAMLALPHARAAWHRQQMIAVLSGPPSAKRSRAALRLGRAGDLRAVGPLVEDIAAGEARNWFQSREIAVLCELDHNRVTRDVTAAIADPAADASALARALACVGTPSARNTLEDMLGGDDNRRAVDAAVALATQGDAWSLALLVKALAQADPPVHAKLVASLVTGGEIAPSRQVTALVETASRDVDQTVRAAAAEALWWARLNRTGSTGSDQPPDGIDVDPRQLARAARQAAAFLAQRQHTDGYWHTAIGVEGLFAKASIERNAFLTPVLVDLLDPVASRTGLSANLSAARAQVARDIEDTGLVRYYGKPDEAAPAPGCTIVYDTDDTALAWRLAGLDDAPRREAALATLRDYRLASGLYQTWLAPDDGLECVDVGDNPNPADIGIQMHVLMVLAQADPPAGRELCSALAEALSRSEHWVYYERQPLIPLLREPDLAAAGCPVAIPEARIRTDFVGQGKWLALLRSLVRGTNDEASDATLLRAFARNDFLAIRRAPPMLYQNDASANIPALYWSPEVGYALWLRLYYRWLDSQ